MGTKGDATRARVIATTAALMNAGGWRDLPVSAVLTATGLQKGGLYRHFDGRDALAHAALTHAIRQVRDRLVAATAGCDGALDPLRAMLGAYALDGDAVDVPLPGGCPIQNAAIEGDHADDGLRAIALAAMSDWRGWIERLVAGGIASGELRPNVDPVEVSAVVVGGLEGGVMLAHLYRSPEPLAAAVRRLRAFVDALEAP